MNRSATYYAKLEEDLQASLAKTSTQLLTVALTICLENGMLIAADLVKDELVKRGMSPDKFPIADTPAKVATRSHGSAI